MQICSKCQATQLDAAKYCSECGSQLEQVSVHSRHSTISKNMENAPTTGDLATDKAINLKSNQVILVASVILILVLGFVLYRSQGAATSPDSQTTTDSQITSNSNGNMTESTGVCAFGTLSLDFSNACESPDGLVTQLTGKPDSAMMYAGGGVFYVQFVVKNHTQSPLSVTASTQLKTSDGSTYDPIRTDDPLNPGGICQYAYSTWTVNLNPDAYSELGACFVLSDGITVNELDAFDESGVQIMGLRLNDRVNSNG